MCSYFSSEQLNFLGSQSPGRGGYDECDGEKTNPANAEENAFDKADSCSRKKTRQSDGWTSSEDEADAVEQSDEGTITHLVCLTKIIIAIPAYIYLCFLFKRW